MKTLFCVKLTLNTVRKEGDTVFLLNYFWLIAFSEAERNAIGIMSLSL